MTSESRHINRTGSLRGTIRVPGDKSISHRAVLFGSIAEGDTVIDHFLPSADCLSTIACMRKLGVEIEIIKNQPESDSADSDLRVIVHGRGLRGLAASPDTLDAGNSGTTTRLLSGILAGQAFEYRITGDASLTSRPMRRIIDPLTAMGARIFSERNNGCAPLFIGGRPLKGIAFRSPVASAQVKSCILLAGLYADGVTSVTEPALSRDHTERMLRSFGVPVVSDGLTASIDPARGTRLIGQAITVPGDISSAAYFLAAGLLVPGSDLILKNVGINPTRSGILRVIEMMGGSYEILSVSTVGESGCGAHCPSMTSSNGISHEHAESPMSGTSCDHAKSPMSGTSCDHAESSISGTSCDHAASLAAHKACELSEVSQEGEPVADIRVRSCPLHGTEIGGDIIPTLIDEIPIIAVMAAFAEGTTVIRDAAELKVKETDRIALITENLRAMGADVTATDDGMIIQGKPLAARSCDSSAGTLCAQDRSASLPDTLHGTVIKTLKDHRIAMAFSVAGLLTGDMEIEDADCVSVSYPAFFESLSCLHKH